MLQTALVSIISSALVGVGTGYVTVRIRLSRMHQRQKHSEESIDRLQTTRGDFRDSVGDIRERLTRLETKVDMILRHNDISTDPS